MAERPEQALRRQRLPVGPSRIRVRRSRPGLADPAVRRTADLAVPGGPRHAPGPQGQRRAPQSALALPAVRRRHRTLLRRGPDMGPAHAPFHRGILALVGGASLGGRLLRSLRHYRDRVLLHAARPDPARPCRQVGAALGHHLPVRRHHRNLPSPVFLRHADRGPGIRLGLQRAGSGAAHHGGVFRDGRSAQRPAGSAGCSATGGRSTSSSRSRSGTWWAPDCSDS